MRELVHTGSSSSVGLDQCSFWSTFLFHKNPYLTLISDYPPLVANSGPDDHRLPVGCRMRVHRADQRGNARLLVVSGRRVGHRRAHEDHGLLEQERSMLRHEDGVDASQFRVDFQTKI